MSATPQPTTMGPARSTSQVPRVLIVEDELLVAWHLESLAREQNLEVCGLVPDGDGAIEQATDLDADLILMDIRLAGRMDGIEAARRSRHETAVVASRRLAPFGARPRRTRTRHCSIRRSTSAGRPSSVLASTRNGRKHGSRR